MRRPECDEIVTVSGLAYELGMTTRALRYYEDKNEFLPTIRRAKQRAEMAMERLLVAGKQATGPIFNLKNNFGWKDREEINISGDPDNPLKVDHSFSILPVSAKPDDT